MSGGTTHAANSCDRFGATRSCRRRRPFPSCGAGGARRRAGSTARNLAAERREIAVYAGTGPISETRTYARGPNGVEGTILRRFQDGRSERIEYISEYDREYPVMGTAAYNHIQLKRLDARTAEAVLSHAGRVYGTARRVIAADGKTMTITLRTESASASGGNVINVAIYEKSEP